MRTFIVAHLLLALVTAGPCEGAVWRAEHEWNASWEQRYSDWVASELDVDFFMRGRYGAIRHDCADALYAIRIIFSYENRLPFVISDPRRRGQLIGNATDSFDEASDPLLAFIDFISRITSTRELSDHTYPVAITREHVRPGTLLVRARTLTRTEPDPVTGEPELVMGSPGHAEIVKRVQDTGLLLRLFSTSPRIRQRLLRSNVMSFAASMRLNGLRNWKWPRHYVVPEKNLPGYSLEQFWLTPSDVGPIFSNSETDLYEEFEQVVQARLGHRKEDVAAAVGRFLSDICSQLHKRAEIVRGAKDKREELGRCLRNEEIGAYSTPSRDRKIRNLLRGLLRKQHAIGAFGFLARDSRILASLQARIQASCKPLLIDQNRWLSPYQALRHLLAGNGWESNPNLEIDARWGHRGALKSPCGEPPPTGQVHWDL